MRKIFKLLPFYFIFCLLAACSSDEDVRTPEDITGIWSPDDTEYYEFTSEYRLQKLNIEFLEGGNVGLWTDYAYLYEPGYNFVMYLEGTMVTVYQIVELTHTRMIWCPVKQVQITEVENPKEVGWLVGDIIKEAQKGFHLDSGLYETFNRVSKDAFYSMLDNLGIPYPTLTYEQ